MIINSINILFTQVITSITASVGNLLVSDDCEKKYDIYKKIRFLNVWLSTFAAISLFIIMDDFIIIWIGKKYLLSTTILLVLVINYYFQATRSAFNVFQDAAGIYYEDRFVPLAESIANILFSILFAKLFGLVGIFMGTISSQLILHLYSFYKYVYKNLFNRNYKEYLLEFFKYLITFIVLLGVTYFISKNIVVNNMFLSLVKSTLISLVIPNIILIIIYYKSDEFKFFKKLILKK